MSPNIAPWCKGVGPSRRAAIALGARLISEIDR